MSGELMDNWWFVGGIILFLLLLSGFFSGSETALTAASRARMHQLKKQGEERAKTVLELHDRKDRMIGAILLGNNLVNILASALATSLFLVAFGEAGVVYATLVMTLLVLIFAEVLPKTWALANPNKFALVVGPIMRVVITVFSPFTLTVQAVVRATLHLMGVRLHEEWDDEHKEEELRGVIDLHDGEDPETQQERKMLNSILDLDDVEVSDVMTHRSEVVTLDLSLPTEENINKVLSSPFTRIPLTEGDQDNIVGILHAKPLLRAIREQEGNAADIDLKALSSPPWFVPDSTTLLDQLQAFRERREHFAVVVDEYGSLMGIVTLEDILEEIVGNIDDEHDVTVRGVHPQPDGDYVIDGSVTIRDLNRDLEWDLPDDDAATVAGLVLYESRLIPEAGQVFSFYGYRFEVLRRHRNRIKTVRVTPPARPEEHVGED
ncbi:HlyC/CorC family transporter [Aestuariispira insulae]|uniref:Mg2+/Co2+ transporter CorB n=1 Tax=Aestuariispira insulae TaxID=1461337 RepID=A0A3D9HPK1_9PROT|nr:HlyC/CorC family transporter [Aestuariispira insulae]RED51241.1 Mg2+/Co2+ transporter CorB [Aestuariispira insulae]